MSADGKWSLSCCLAFSGREILKCRVDKHSTIRQVREDLRRGAGDSLTLLQKSWHLLFNGKILPDEAVVQHVLVDCASVDVVCSSQARVVVTASNDCTARVFDLDSGNSMELCGHFGQVYACTISSSCSQLLTASEDKTARVWALDGWLPVEKHCLRHDGEVYSAVFSSCGSLVITASQDCTACLWCSHTGKRQWQFLHTADVYLATFSPDDISILTASADGFACIVSVETGEASARLGGHGGSVNRAEFSPAIPYVVTASGATLRIWNGTTCICLHTRTGDSEIKFANFSADGELLLTTRASGSAEVWSVSTGELNWTCAQHSEAVYMAASCQQGTQIALAGEDGKATVWTRNGELIRTLSDHVDAVTWISFSPFENLVVTASWDGTAMLWSTETGECVDVLEGHAAAVLYAEFGFLSV